MRTSLFMSVIMLAVTTVVSAQDKPAAKKQGTPALKTTIEQASYAIGADIGKNLKRAGVEVNGNLIAK